VLGINCTHWQQAASQTPQNHHMPTMKCHAHYEMPRNKPGGSEFIMILMAAGLLLVGRCFAANRFPKYNLALAMKPPAPHACLQCLKHGFTFTSSHLRPTCPSTPSCCQLRTAARLCLIFDTATGLLLHPPQRTPARGLNASECTCTQLLAAAAATPLHACPPSPPTCPT
jgi:hypothetical protein